MFHYRVTIAYKGTNYRGWQAQSSDVENEALPTVQGTIRRCLRKIARYQECTISGTSRTDAGVHAQGQVGKISLPVEIQASTLLRGLNSMLPSSIRIAQCARCDGAFNAKTFAASKEYHYYFSSAPVANPLLSDVVAQVPGPLNLELIAEASSLFVGTHDFYNFCRRPEHAANTIRHVSCCELVASSPAVLVSDVQTLRVIGDGFLKQMIRYMASALLEVGRGNLSSDKIADALEQHRTEKLCAKAPPQGLHLIKVTARECELLPDHLHRGGLVY